MKKKLITIATPEILPLCQDFLNNQRNYADVNGYTYAVVYEKHWRNIHPSFSKVHEIKQALDDGYEYIIWADADVAFMDQNFDLATLISDDAGNFLAAYHQTNWPQWVYLCAGLMVIRNTPEAHRFFLNWWLRCEHGYIVDKPWEQWYFDELIREINYRGIRACSATEIGCFCPQIWHDGTKWKPGMPTVHMAGQATWEERTRIFKEIYAPKVIIKK